MSDTLQSWLAAWYNAPFLLSLLVGLGLLAVSLFGAVGDAGTDVDLDLELEVDADLDADAPSGFAGSGLGWFGVGKAPASTLLQTLLTSFGLIGLTINAIARDLAGGGSPLVFPVAVLASALGAVSTTRLVGLTFARWMPNDQPTSRDPRRLIGLTGVAATSVSRSIGQARVAFAGTNDPDAILNVRLDDSSTSPLLPRDSEIIVTGYDPARRMFTVAPTPKES